MTSNYDLERMAKRYKIPLTSVLSKDQLSRPDLIRKLKNMSTFNLILNLQDSVNDNGEANLGTHWVCLSKLNNTYLYFDSYGFPPPIEVSNLAHIDNIRNIIYTEKQIQKLNTEMCGQYCLMFLDYVQSGLRKGKKRDIKSIVNDFVNEFNNNPSDSDKKLKVLMREYF